MSAQADIGTGATAARRRLPVLDRYLALWILLAVLAGIGLGQLSPSAVAGLNALTLDGVSVPVALGLLLMMYPPLAKVRYEKVGAVIGERRLLTLSLALNWVVGPLLMFALALIFLREHPSYMVALILIGIARCIAMVLIWIDLAGGHKERAVALVAVNSIFQIAAYALYAYVFLTLLPPLFGLDLLGAASLEVGPLLVAKNVLIYLGIPFALGYMSRRWLSALKGESWYEEVFLRRIGPMALGGLLFTIFVMFSMKGDSLLALPGDALLVAVPLVIYFVVMFIVSYLVSRRLAFDHETSVTTSFTAAGNNFELALAVAIGVFGIGSQVAFAAIIGPLVEVPVMVGLVWVANLLGSKMKPHETPVNRGGRHVIASGNERLDALPAEERG